MHKMKAAAKLASRTTVYLRPKLHRALRLKSIEVSTSMSDLINDAVEQALAEDADDLMAIRKRKQEPKRSFDVFVRELRRDGLI